MARKTLASHGFTPPEKRITKEINAQLEALAPLFQIQVKHLAKNKVELSGPGFSGEAPLVLTPTIAKIRLLAELTSILARWIPFSLWEPCEVTLFAVAPSRIERCAYNFRKDLNKAAKAATKAANAARIAAEQAALAGLGDATPPTT